jgi:hypothetical protein
MKEFRWYLIAAMLVVSMTAAEAQFPRPRPSSAPPPQAQAQVQAPAEQREIVVPAPQVTVQAPPQSDFFNYVFAGLGTVFTALFGFNVFKSSGGGLPKLTPEARAGIDAAAGRFIESGIPGQALQAGAGFVPGLGGIAALVEPMARRAALEFVAQREAANRAAGTAAGAINPDPLIPATILNENLLTSLADKLAERIKARIAA